MTKNSIAKNTMFMYLRMFFVMVISLFTVRVVLKTLGVDDYGVYSAVGGIVASLTFITNVLAIASQRFLSVEIGKGKNGTLRQTFSTIVLIYSIVGMMTILFSETVGLWFLNNKMTIPNERMSAALGVFHCTVFTFIISIVTAPHQAMIISKEKMNIYAYVGILDVMLKLILVFLICTIDYDKLILYAILMAAVSFICNSIYVIYSYVNYKESRFQFSFQKSIFKDIFKFSSWTLFGSIAYVCNTQGINLILNVFFGPVVNAAYAIGNQVKTAINSFSSNFYVAVRPAMMKSYAADNFSYVEHLFYFSSKLIFVLLFVLVFPIASHISFILNLWLGSVGDYMPEFVTLMLVYAIVLSMSDPITTIVQAANKVKYYYLFVDGFTLLTLPLSYMSFKLGCPPIAAFVISIVIFIIAHLIRLLYLSHLMPSITIMNYTKKVFIPIAITVLLVLVVSYLLSNMIVRNIVNEILTLVFDFILSVSICFLIILSKEERKSMITLIVKNFIKKK